MNKMRAYFFLITVIILCTVIAGCGGANVLPDGSVNNNNVTTDSNNQNNNSNPPGNNGQDNTNPLENDENGTFEGLTLAVEKQILLDYFNNIISPAIDLYPAGLSIDDLWIDAYDGTYNGSVIVNIKGPWWNKPLQLYELDSAGKFYSVKVHDDPWYAPSLNYKETIGGVFFWFHIKDKPIAWKAGTIYEIDDAYKAGILTEGDLKQIVLNNPRNYSEEIAQLMKEGEGRLEYNMPGGAKGAHYILEYYGNYNGYVTGIVDLGQVSAVWRLNIDGVPFSTPQPPIMGILGWKDGFYYKIEDLYAEGKLTLNDIIMISNLHNGNSSSMWWF